MITIICPIYNEEKYIENCIKSILIQDYPKEELEVLFVDGMSKDKTRKVISYYAEKYSFIKLIDNPTQIVPSGLNIGIRLSKGEIIIRLDAHASYPSNYFSVLVLKLNELKADNVGAICNTLPVDNSIISRAIAIALSNRFGMGNSYFRIGANKEIKVDTVPFGCFNKKIFDKIGLFDEDLVRNQDDEFNGRINRNNGKIYLIPSLVVNYYARDSISKVRKMFFQYGLFKPLVNKKLGSPATIRQFFPPLFVIGMMLGIVLSLIYPWFLFLYIVIISLYIILALLFASNQSHDYREVFLLPYIFFSIHASYGLGYIIGILKIIGNKKLTANSNR